MYYWNVLGAFTAVYRGALGLILSFPLAPHLVGSRLKLRLRVLIPGKKVPEDRGGGGGTFSIGSRICTDFLLFICLVSVFG